MDENLEILEKEYCPPIDPALVHAIYWDFAETSDGVQSARSLLDGIKQTAQDEQSTDFDPSGNSGGQVRSNPSKPSSSEAESNPESWASQTTATDCTNLSNNLSTLSLGASSGSGSEDSSEGGYFQETQHFDTRTKELLLVETFPTLRSELVAYTLKKCSNDFSRASDELLNQVYFEDSQSSPSEEVVVTKGIDAFAEEHHVPHRGKKGKGKRKYKIVRHSDSSLSSISETDLSSRLPANKWLEGNRDVAFIASRTTFTSAAISSLYHRNGASISATIMALVEKDIATNCKNQEPNGALLKNALDLNSDFPTLDLAHAMALIRLSVPSTANAHELAKALTIQPGTSAQSQGSINVIPQYAPVNLSDPTPTSLTKLPALPPSALPRTTASLSAARGEAFTQASAAYRKGKSNPLMKAAAGYYAQVGRDLSASLRTMTESEAEALVSSQSSPTVLDLHGVNVNSATRIAKERVRDWWDALGEQRIPGGGGTGVGDGYRVITGLGRHSEGGKGKIGPAVVQMLLKEGWKVEVGTGEVTVVGMARRR
ncbi:hypothetical protein CC78DRAFT_512277 [Lojkania enalia]|uniref:Smr domain-containing protein n=1 Tax=Lojkania enalia TaxID=147567 RepID=A0A9P4N5P2_9PLEO|nr:hypothetical protein CC78DRAFT_512277 [Didymosphaeria enalia]